MPGMEAGSTDAARLLKQFGSEVYTISKKLQALQQAQAKLGTWQDTAELRSNLTTRTSALKAAFAEATSTCRAASALVLAPSSDQSPFRAASIGTLQRLERDLLDLCEQYRQVGDSLVQKCAASKPRSPRVAQETPLQDVASRGGGGEAGASGQQSQLTSPLLLEQVHDMRDEIADRDQGIADVVASVLEVRQDMQDINELLHHQDPLIQQVAVNVQDTDFRIEEGFNQVQIASRRTKKFFTCWNITVIVVGASIGLLLAFSLPL